MAADDGILVCTRAVLVCGSQPRQHCTQGFWWGSLAYKRICTSSQGFILNFGTPAEGDYPRTRPSLTYQSHGCFSS
jgi:hypothetical protein